jgi:hypothetical protein
MREYVSYEDHCEAHKLGIENVERYKRISQVQSLEEVDFIKLLQDIAIAEEEHNIELDIESRQIVSQEIKRRTS